MKTESVEVRMHTDEKRAFREAAELAGIPLSAWIRERLRRASARELADVGRQVPFLQAKRDE
jgi:uncharacterized protein (DUF1778 family)